MKKLLTLSAFIFLSVMLSKAQTPTPMVSADFPSPGDSSDVKEYTISPTQTYADSTSANDSLTIDRTLEKALQAINDTYMDDISIGGNQTDTVPIVIYSQFPGANAFHRVYGTVNGFLPGATSFPTATTYTYVESADGPAYVYYQNDATGFYELGSYLMPTGNPAITMVNTPKKPVVTFPVDYNTPANVTGFSSSTSGGGIATTTNLEVTVDAYGTLVIVSGSVSTPVFTTYTDYLRVVQYSLDTMDLGSGMLFFIESKYYNYYIPGRFDPIIAYSVAKIRSNIDPMYWSMAGQWEDEIEVQWNKEFMPVGVSESDGWQLNLFPNPTSGNVTLDMPAFSGENVQMDVYSVAGQLIASQSFSDGLIQMDLSGQPEGIYTVRINANGHVFTSKLVIAQ
ncbi:MAG: hypothetical protein CVU11_05180 [Bacteroidetes bacterium HGW-Bacteroidetes-6]|jgi:hypothetical protein|nr:MAG: hypothetical protein CVU11_05180 [Bacteroidetes bacterium HGW-Bacteroidetes-6]